MERLDTIRRLNVEIFDDEHIIKTFDRDDLLILLARSTGTVVGFKLGYQLDADTFYSAKGGVRSAYRRNGIARALLCAMLDVVEQRGYERFVYDFEVVRAGYSTQYQDYRLRFEWTFGDSPS
ncbi:MAG: N-acetyltransferase [Bacteroidetes bacterium QH_7_64_110]|nr:MAG: N-acetyltransferase [Bacteroidetes bacterium QH_7_64_110]